VYLFLIFRYIAFIFVTMPSLNHYIDEIYSGTNITSDDAILDNRQISEWIRVQRSLLVRNIQTNDKKDIDLLLFQTIPCLKMDLVDRSLSDCCVSGYEVGCSILRSVMPLPRLLFTKGQYGETGTLIVNVPDILRPQVVYGTRNTAIYGGSGRFNKNSIYTFIELDKNGHPYLYAVSKNRELALGGRVFHVRGIFESPQSLSDYVSCDGGCLFDEESEYPISSWMWEPIRLEVIKKINIMYGRPADKQNDASDSSEQQANEHQQKKGSR